MNRTIANLLNKLLGVWIEDLNSEQLNLSIFSGTILLHEVRLKSDFLDILGLPFDLSFGTVDTIKVKIPWASWYSSPLEIDISNISILLKPTSPDQWSEQKEKSLVSKIQKYYLEHFELMNPEDLDSTNEEGFSEVLLAKLIENLQVTVKNFYVRYEDCVSSGETFCLGMYAKEFAVFTCNSLWEHEFQRKSTTYYKLCQCSELSVFLDYGEGIVQAQQWYEGSVPKALRSLIDDEVQYRIFHRYLVSPASFRVEIVLNRDTNMLQVPPISVNVITDKLRAQVYLTQAQLLVSLKKLIDSHWKFKQEIENSIQHRGFSLYEIGEYRKAYMEFRSYCNDEEINAEEKESMRLTLEALENGIFIEDIKIQRKIVLTEIKAEKAQKEKKDEFLKISSMKNKKALSSMIIDIIKSKSAAERKEEEEKQLEKLKTTEKDLIRLETRSSSILRELYRSKLNKLQFFEDTIEKSLSLIVQDFSFEFLDERREYIVLECKGIGFYFAERLASVKYKLKFSKVIVWNKYNPASIFPILLRSEYAEMEFDNLSNNKLKVQTGATHFCVDLECLMKILEILIDLSREVLTTSQSFNSDSVKTDEDIPFFQRTVKRLLECGITDRYDLDININFTEISIPVDIRDVNSSIFLLSFENLSINTTKENIKRMAFDVYNSNIKNLKLSVDNLDTRYTGIILPCSLMVQFYVCKTRQFNRCGYRLKISVNKAKLQLSDIHIDLIFALSRSITKIHTISESPIDISMDSYTQQHSNIDSFVMSLEEIIKTKLQVEFNELSLALVHKEQDFVGVEMYNIMGESKINKHKHISAKLCLENLEILDLTAGGVHTCLVSVPIRKELDPEFEDAKQEIYNVFISLSLIPQDNFTDILLKIAEIKVFGILETLKRVLLYFNDISRNFVKYGKVNNEYTYTIRESISVKNLRYSVYIEDCAISLFLETPSSWSWIDLYFNSTTVYESVTKHKLKYTSSKHKSRNQKTQEKSLNFTTQFSSLLVILRNSSQRKVIVNPTRITLDYDLKTALKLPQKVKIELRFEHIHTELGFRDIDFLSKLNSTWSALMSPQSPHPPQSFQETDLTVYLGSFSILLQEDTPMLPYSLLTLRLTSTCASISITPVLTTSLISSSISLSYYNKYLKYWEPVLESWKFLLRHEKALEKNGFSLEISSGFKLNINMNNSIAECLGTVVQKYYEEYWDWGEMYGSSIVNHSNLNYQLINNLGVDVLFWFDAKPPEQILLKNGAKLDVKYGEAERVYVRSNGYKLYDMDRPHTVCVYIPDFPFITGVVIEDFTYQTFELKNSEGSIKIRKDIVIRDSTRFVTLSNNVSVINTAKSPITLMYDQKEFIVDDIMHVPIDWNLEEIFICTLLEFRSILNKGIFQYTDCIYMCIDLRPYQYQGIVYDQGIVISSPYTFVNLLPFALILHIENQKLQRIDSGQSWEYYSIGVSSSQITLEILAKGENLETEVFSLDLPEQEIKILNNCKWKILVALTQETLCSQITISCSTILVNSTEYDIIFGKATIPRQTIGFFQDTRKTQRIKIISDIESDPSEEFDLSTMGLAECLSLSTHRGPSKSLLLGLCIIPSPLPFVGTKLLKLQPRFVVINHLDFPVFLRQYDVKHTFSVKTVEANRHLHYQFDDCSISSNVQISEDGEQWSSPFSINNIDEFQVRFRAKKQNIATPGEDTDRKKKPWYLPSRKNNMFYYARVVVNTENQASLNIYLTNPQQPEFEIYNNSYEVIYVKQYKISQEYYEVPPKKRVPWVFDNYLVQNKKIKIRVLNFKQTYSFEKIQDKFQDIDSFYVKGYCLGNSRIIEIYDNLDKNLIADQPNNSAFFDSYNRKFSFLIKSIDLSFFDKSNSEKLLLSLEEFDLKYKRKDSNLASGCLVSSKLSLILGGFQADNMDKNPKLFPVICQRSSIDSETPFLELKYHRETSHSTNSSLISGDLMHYFEVQVQPISLYINHEVFLNLFNLQKDLVTSYYLLTPPTPPTSPELEQLLETQTLYPRLPEQPSKTYFKFMRITNTEIKLTFRKSKTSIILPHFPQFLRSISNIFVEFAGITESPLNFKQIIIENSYQNRYSLLWAVISNYSKQGLSQFYRILGATQILGNPIGLLDKLGTGVYEFFSEPAKGLLISPRAFVKGMGKGTRSLVSKMVTGGLGTVANITGSLYNVVSEEYSESQTLFKDLGLIDLTLGVTGIGTKPYRGFKENGLVGLAKGATKGILGASVAPIAALLHFSHSVTARVLDGVEKMDEGYRRNARRRCSRYLNSKGVIFRYDRHMAKLDSLIGEKGVVERSSVRHFVELDEEDVIVTDGMIVVFAENDVVKEIEISRISTMEIHYYQKRHVLLLNTGRCYYLSCKARAPIYKLYLAINSI